MSQSRQRIDDFLNRIQIGFLATLNKDGSPNVMPLWYDWDGQSIRMFTSANTAKITRLENDPRACLTVADGVGVPGDWVSVEGDVEISNEGGLELARKLAIVYYEPAQAEDAIKAWSQLNDLVLLELNATRIRAWSRLAGFYSERL